jgi:TRAP-type C4-dicarboxylate transport system permease small subunit
MLTRRALADVFDRAAAVAACALVVALLVCVSLGVLTRELGAPLIWTDELSRFLMVWLAVLGWVLASRRRIHVRIRYFQDRLPVPARKGVEIVIQLGLATLGTLIAIYSVGLVIKNHDLEATTLPMSMSWLYAPMVLAGVVTAVQGCVELVETIRRRRPSSAPAVVEVE